MYRLIVLAALAALLAASTAPAAVVAGKPKQLTARKGKVTATVSFREQPFLVARNVRLRIERAGELVIDEKLRSDQGDPAVDLPTAVRVLDLDADGGPEVLVDLYTGGAHCCSYSLIYRFDPAASEYLSIAHQWGNVGWGPQDVDGDGTPELESADDRFAYAFTAYAYSSFPPQVWRYRDGALVDSTREFPKLVRAEARALWRTYIRERHRVASERDLRGVLAAWQACKALLGEAEDGWATLREARARGELRGPSGWPSGYAYLKALRAFLEQTGYLAA